MKKIIKIFVATLSAVVFCMCGINRTIINATELMCSNHIQPCGQIIPVNKNFSVYASCKNGGYAIVMFSVKGTYEKGTYSITNVNLNHTYYVNVSGITSYSVESANVSYRTTGNTIYAVATVTLKVVSNGKTSYISGSTTEQL